MAKQDETEGAEKQIKRPLNQKLVIIYGRRAQIDHRNAGKIINRSFIQRQIKEAQGNPNFYRQSSICCTIMLSCG